MADNFAEYQDRLDEFNSKYSLNFNLGEFDVKARGLSEFGSDKVLDPLYKNTFISLYKKVFNNCVDTLINSSKADPTQFLEDFEKVMQCYREVCGKEGRPAPSPNGGWKNSSEPMNRIKKELETVSDNKIKYAEQRYLSGELRIRDMRNYVHVLSENYQYIPKEERVKHLSTIHCYTEALKNANAQRSFLWKVFHLSRYLGEQRAIDKFQKYLTPRIASVFTKQPNVSDPNVEKMKSIANDDSVVQLKNEVESAFENVIDKEPAKDAPEENKMPISVEEAAMEQAPVENVEKISIIDVPTKDTPNIG